MIYINRPSYVPAAFRSKSIENDKKIYRKFYRGDKKKRAQQKFLRSLILGNTPETLEAGAKLVNYKCAACETSLKDGEYACDSWRPRENATGMDNEFSGDHYWWLAHEWRNKYMLCPIAIIIKLVGSRLKGHVLY